MVELESLRPAVICLTSAALSTAERIAQAVDGDVHGLKGRVETAITFENTLEHLATLFLAARPIIGVCAAGILIRAVGPHATDKWSEPPVLAVTEDGAFVVTLLGAHHGGTDLARTLNAKLQSQPVLTTASDQASEVALDTPPGGWRLLTRHAAKPVTAHAIAGAHIEVAAASPDTAELFAKDWLSQSAWTLNVSTDPIIPDGHIHLRCGGAEAQYAIADLVVGMGCARGTPVSDLTALLDQALAHSRLSRARIAGLFSIDVKSDERGLHDLATDLGVPLRFFSAPELEAEHERLANPSDVVFAEVGCHGVAEGAALRAAGRDAELTMSKVKSDTATCAIARIPTPAAWSSRSNSVGRPRGRLSVIGIGPGREDWRTPAATRAIAEVDELVGYGLYIDLLGPLARGKKRSDFPLGGEAERCRYALEAASQGRNVALVCSGDAGIYAMGALVMEVMHRDSDDGGVSAAAKRVEVVNIPGVSALQAASARAGALLGHDFCAISLSDLLTPRETIIKRLHAAAHGDFVIAFYNPVSKRRRTLLAEARDILLEHRPADTPVLLGVNLGRPEEKLLRRTLSTLKVDEVDMLTTVVVGSSQSVAFPVGDVGAGADGEYLYTPRGYAKKMNAAVDATGRDTTQVPAPQFMGAEGETA